MGGGDVLVPLNAKGLRSSGSWKLDKLHYTS